jgi:hypothetical protein
MSDKIVKLGLGEAVQRLIRVEVAHALGYQVRDVALSEAKMLRETLDQYDLEVAWDCNLDEVPDTVDIYAQAADTSCCRIVSVPQRDVGRTRAPQRRNTTSSRRDR